MVFAAFLQKWKLLSSFILFTCSALSCAECSYSIRDDEGCEEMSRSPVCSVNHSARCGVTQKCSDLQAPGRLPRPAVWLFVALLSALAGATACCLANRLAPPPGYRVKARMKDSSGARQLTTDTSQTRHTMRQPLQTSLTNDDGFQQQGAS